MSIFITFEGIEGSGKSTQASLLAEYLKEKGFEVFQTREPGGPVISEKIRDILLDNAHTEMLPETELLLYMASRAQHTGESIIPALEANKIVICDRYLDSTYAYQGGGRNINSEVIRKIGKYATFGVAPDLTIILDIEPDLGLARILDAPLDRIELEDISFHRRVREYFLNEAKKDQKRYKVIDGIGSKSDIHSQIKDIVLTKLEDGK